MTKFLRFNWREILLTILLLAAFRLWPFAWQTFVDPQSAASDSGVVHLLVFGALGATFVLTMVWLLKWVFFPTLDAFIDLGQFARSFRNDLTHRQQLWFCAGAIVFLAWLVIKCAELAK